ncbi:Disease resistance protein RFL1 [Camellia lanceoleosa]|uniref:Disease resistance protein RFL1 n=1 Tax=Camellia lanceoleosa TaxID=1840588 RepID=A0ACC0IPF3_9ERIC|nr:Disease resistance protein RFL1 [Camellia lanceoleosa]
MIKEVEKLHENGEFSNGLLIDDPTCGHAIPTAESLAETTSAGNTEKIWNFLMDDMVRKISVLGMGAVGKTTITKHINNKLLDETRIRHTVKNIHSTIEIGKNLCDLTGPWVGYHNNLDTNMETLKRKTKQLNVRNNDVNEEVNCAEQQSRKDEGMKLNFGKKMFEG